MVIPIMQRKIPHLLKSINMGRQFYYIQQLNIQFDLHKPILVTEKVDGSTGQSWNGELWKRFDLFKKGDPRKREAPPEKRYELRKCDPNDPALKWYFASFNAYHDEFQRFGEKFPTGWIFFELLGTKINTRYPRLTPTIRVFDYARNGKFFPFIQTISIAKSIKLPLVECKLEIFHTVSNLLSMLEKAETDDYDLRKFPLEGWVLRQQEKIAKIRKSDLKKLR